MNQLDQRRHAARRAGRETECEKRGDGGEDALKRG